jgi:hypothetical protein
MVPATAPSLQVELWTGLLVPLVLRFPLSILLHHPFSLSHHFLLGIGRLIPNFQMGFMHIVSMKFGK